MHPTDKSLLSFRLSLIYTYLDNPISPDRCGVLVMIINICGQDCISRLMHLYKIKHLQLALFHSNLFLKSIMVREQVEKNLRCSSEARFSMAFRFRKIYALFFH